MRLLTRTTVAAGLLAAGLAASVDVARASYTVDVRDDALIVKGDAAGDRLALRVRASQPGKLQVDVDDDGTAEFKVNRNRFDSIRVRAGRGADRIRIDESQVAFTDTTPTLLDGQRGPDTLLGGRGGERLIGGLGGDTADGNGGADTATLGAGNDRFIWDPGDGSDTVEGRRGRDAMTFNGSGGNEVFAVAANGARARFTRDVGAVTMDLDDVEQIDLAAAGGQDRLTQNDLAATDVRTLNADLGAVDNALDTVVASGSNAADTIVAAGSGGTVAVTGLAATLNLTNADSARDRMAVNTLAGDDRLTAGALAANAIKLVADAGAGNDTILGSAGPDIVVTGDGNDTIDGNQGDDVALMGAGDDRFAWDPGDGNDTLEGQDGSDRMAFNGNGAAEQFDVAANGGRVRFLRNVANITMDLDDVERIELAALGGADRLIVNDASGTDLRNVAADLGAGDNAQDEVVVNGTNGDDAIVVAGADGSASVRGLAAQVDIAQAQQDGVVVRALAGDDVVEASGLAASALRLTALGGNGDDILVGGDGQDTLAGEAGDDVLVGGPGVDELDGGPGDNTVIQG